MSKIEYGIRMRSPAVLSGEELWVEVSFLNRGDEPFPVPGRGDPSPFEFVLATEPGPRARSYYLSFHTQRISLFNTHTLPLSVRSARDLAPGRSTTRPEEIASYNSEPLLAGRYTVGLTIRESSSKYALASSNVEIRVPSPVAFAAQSCLMSRKRLAILSQPEGQQWALLFRESQLATPRHSSFLRRLQKAGSPASSAAVAVNVVHLKPEPRWYAWIENSAGIFAQNLWGESKPTTLGPLPFDGIATPRLIATGFNIAPRTSFFLVLGAKASAGVIRKYDLRERELTLAWEAPFGGPQPSQCLARCQQDQITLVSPGATASQILIREYSLDGKPLTDKRLEFNRPIAAYDIEPATSFDSNLRAEAPLHVLLHPDGKSQMEYRRVQDDMTTELEPLHFLSPAIKASSYTICTGRMNGVLAKAGQQILLLKGRTKSWQSVADRAASAERLQLYTLDGHEYYAEWLDAESGFHLVRLTGQ